MKKGMILLVAVLFFAGMSFSGCTKKTVKTEAGAEMPTAAAGPSEGRLLGGPESIEVEDIDVMEEESVEEVALALTDESMSPGFGASDEVEGLVLQDVFFDYDRHVIREDARKALLDNAEFLKQNKHVRITIEGHCDERGTIEYNVALGERRAVVVKSFLKDLGVDPNRIKIVSYGKEKPFCSEHGVQCWQKNRRAHIVVR